MAKTSYSQHRDKIEQSYSNCKNHCLGYSYCKWFCPKACSQKNNEAITEIDKRSKSYVKVDLLNFGNHN